MCTSYWIYKYDESKKEAYKYFLGNTQSVQYLLEDISERMGILESEYIEPSFLTLTCDQYLLLEQYIYKELKSPLTLLQWFKEMFCIELVSHEKIKYMEVF